MCGCAYVPPLEQAAGDFEPHILIGEIVDRVKCEISDAFGDKLDDARFAWLNDWTAKVDLTLQINDQAGVSPTASYTRFQKNAFNFAAGSTSLTTTSIAAVNQFFTLSAGAGYGESAQRAETVSFTVSLKEMRDWRNRSFKHINWEVGPDAAAQFCFSNKPELRGNLGLKEWIDSALYPVETGQLQSGIHPSPIGAPSKPQVSTPPKLAGAPPEVDKPQAEAIAGAAAQKAATSASEAQKTVAAIETAQQKIRAARKANIDRYMSTLTPELKRIILHNEETLSRAQADAKENAEKAQAESKSAEAALTDIQKAPGRTVPKSLVDHATDAAKNAQTYAEGAKNDLKAVAKIEAQFAGLKLNPPVDGLLHSLQFIVVYSASVTPNWSLLVWKGPGLTVPGASLSGTKTNVLNIAFGAPGEQNRLIQNITVSNTMTH